MNRMLASVLLASAGTIVGAGCATTEATRTTSACCCQSCVVTPGNASAVDTKTADALRATLMDERRVQEYYNGVLATHGQVRPFANIVHAEARHEAAIESLMTRHGVTVPAEAPTNIPIVPATITECARLAATLERENIAMYDRFLAEVTEADIRLVFENLRAASLNNHLPAFERWSADAGSAPTGQRIARANVRGPGNAGNGCRGGNGGCGWRGGPCVMAP